MDRVNRVNKVNRGFRVNRDSKVDRVNRDTKVNREFRVVGGFGLGMAGRLGGVGAVALPCAHTVARGERGVVSG